MDAAISPEDLASVKTILESYRTDGIEFHDLWTRQAGARKFISFHVSVPGEWTVHRGHELLEKIETGIGISLPDTAVFTHIEPLDNK